MKPYPCSAGVTLLGQIDHRWPKRDKASDGWIGDAAHAATVSDHNPDPHSTPPGCVRARDIDADLDHQDSTAAQTLANQLIACARSARDGGRLSYVIFNNKIASGTYASAYWTWRDYSGDDPHTSHIHVSFSVRGDHKGGRFPLPVFDSARRHRLRKLIDRLTGRIRQTKQRRRVARHRLDKVKP